MKKKKKEKESRPSRELKSPNAFSEIQSKKTIWLFAFLVASITFMVYLPALKNGFVNWDDGLYVYENQNIRLLDFESLKWALTSVVAALWHPVTMLSLMLDYVFWGLNPKGYHLTNNLIHAFNAFLVFILAVQLLKYAEPENGGLRTYP